MHPPDCPVFEYEQHPRRPDLLTGTADLIVVLRQGFIQGTPFLSDSRSTHERLFADLAPPQCPYFAGHYRGEEFRCLKYYAVSVGQDSMVGHPPQVVARSMSDLGKSISAAILTLDAAHRDPRYTREQRLVATVQVACDVFVRFLTVHPYANGNGHIGRFLMWVILGRYGYWPNRWPVDPRPNVKKYGELISRHRRGDWQPLVREVLDRVRN
jgi:hypothetical protein